MKSLKKLLSEALPPVGGVPMGGVPGREYSYQWMGSVSKSLADKVNRLNQMLQKKDPRAIEDLVNGSGAQLIQDIDKEWQWFKEKFSVYDDRKNS
jgi:hypothetical protein